jgi:cytoskeletal protein RodZ
LEPRFGEEISQPKLVQTSTTSQNAKQIFKDIGNKLRERRGLISLTLDDISENIHVNTQYLNALEDGRLDALPSPVQAKGMLANYAEFLNLDGDTLLLRFADGLQLQRLEKQQTPVNRKMSSNEISSTKLRLKNFFSLDLLVMVGLFIGFTSFIIWGVNRILAVDSQDPLATEIPDVSDVLLATSSITPEATDGDETPSEPSATPANGEQENTPIFTPVVSDNPINIVIIPNQQAWVQITSDNALVYEGRLLPGNAYNYSGDEVVEILTGNAGALQIYFNDQAIGAAGFIGQVEKLTFTETGLVRPTPTNPPTSTPTRLGTPSPTDSILIEPTTTP